MTVLLEARNITKVFSSEVFFKRTQTTALENISFSINANPPSIMAVAGESGSGKTTLAKILLGFIAPTKGEVLYRGKNLQKMSRSEQLEFRREVQAIFQDPFEVYNPFYKIDHVFTTSVTKFHLARSKAEVRKLIKDVLEVIGLRPEETLGRYPHQLSGGQRQRIMVARALLLKPRIVLADEPVSMIDASLRATILGSLRKLNQEFGISLLYITHDLAVARYMCDRLGIMYLGKLVERGPTEDILQQPLHPYTKALLSAVPVPDPTLERESLPIKGGVSKPVDPAPRCRFYERCPISDKQCESAGHPPLEERASEHFVACYKV